MKYNKKNYTIEINGNAVTPTNPALDIALDVKAGRDAVIKTAENVQTIPYASVNYVKLTPAEPTEVDKGDANCK